MLVRIKVSALWDTHWHEYALRFGLGGLATVRTGLIAEVFGPATGGLFLAFPAVFCASATLIEKHFKALPDVKVFRPYGALGGPE